VQILSLLTANLDFFTPLRYHEVGEMKLSLLTAVSFLLIGCLNCNKKESLCNTPFESLVNLHHSGIESPEDFCIVTEEGWNRFLKEVNSSFLDTVQIDFTKEIVIACAMGERGNSCHGIEIECIQKDGDALIVFEREIVPGPGCICLAVCVTPLHVVKIRVSAKSVNFTRSTYVMICD